ncbi:hypothetical protein TNIN_71321, partial [Trichonephila inaurata madagascariensis]
LIPFSQSDEVPRRNLSGIEIETSISNSAIAVGSVCNKGRGP